MNDFAANLKAEEVAGLQKVSGVPGFGLVGIDREASSYLYHRGTDFAVVSIYLLVDRGRWAACRQIHDPRPLGDLILT